MRLIDAAAVLALLAAAPAYAAADPARYMPAELIAETLSPKPGTTILVGFRMTPRRGWHGYWSNPGDSGLAPSVAWSAPDGVDFGPLLHPAPTLIRAGGISSFVHEGTHVLLSRMTIGRSIAPGTAIPIEAKLSWAACTATQCVPLQATMKLDLVAGEGTRSTAAGPLRNAVAKLPKQAPNGSYTAAGQTIELRLPATVSVEPRTARFFPDDNDAFDAASSKASQDQSRILIAGAFRALPRHPVTGVVSDGRNAYRLSFVRAAAAKVRETPAAATPITSSEPQSKIASPSEVTPTRTTQEPPTHSWRWLLAVVAIAAAAGALLWWRR